MFTRNWYVSIGAAAFSNLSTENIIALGVKEYTGATATSLSGTSGWVQLTGSGICQGNIGNVITSLGYSKSGVAFGTGTTEPALDDYTLSGNIVSTLTPSSETTITHTADFSSLTCVYTLSNTGDADVTIAEVGLFSTPITNSGYRICLLERTVLDEPVTIPAGGVGRVTYTIRMEYPTA